jgi:succinate dehydrogenase/fumarate reductase flavoprotein subunit
MSHDDTGAPPGAHTRREFLALGAGALALSACGGWGHNETTTDPRAISSPDTHECDVLIVGGGMAALFAAVKAHDAGARTLIVSKGRLGSSGLTPFAKGLFVFDPSKEKVSIDEYVATVSRSALGTNNSAYTKQAAEHSMARIAELRSWGFFESNLYNRSFMVPIEERGIPLLERVVITKLLKDGDRVAGAAGFRLDAEQIVTIRARSVVLCTGAGAFKPNGFPVCDLTHDGTVMAYDIGARVTGKEWNDGHLGRAKHPAATYDGWGDMFDRKPSTDGVGVRHDLGVDANYMAYVQGNPLQAGPGSGKATESIAGGPQTPDEFKHGDEAPADGGRPREGGPPPGGGPGIGGGPPGMRGAAMGGASAGMAIHKSEGLVPINDQCESNVPGLYAAGDALGSYQCGGIYTQIGSSLTGSAVQGAVAGEAAASFAKGVSDPVVSPEALRAIKAEILAPLTREAGYGPAWVTQTLQGVMIPNFVLYIKKESLLQAALAYVEELRDHHVPMLRAAHMHELRLAHETKNMIISAEMKLRASIMRKESRCSHYRLDYPELDDANWRAWINIHKDAEGKMRLEKQPFGVWPDGSAIGA